MKLQKDGKIAREIEKLAEFTLLYDALKDGATLENLGKILSGRGTQPSQADPDRTSYVKRLLDDLEREYGAKLKYKSHGKLHADEDAARFVRHARRIVHEYNNIALSEPQEHVYASVIDIAAHFWIPEALAGMRTLETKENKNVCLHVHVCEWWEVLRDVRDGIADFGMATEIPDDGLHHDLIITSPHRLIVPSKHDIKEPVSMKDLAGQTVVCMHTASGPIAIEHQLRAQNIQARIITVATASQVLAWLSRGLGIGFLPECMVPDDGRFSKLHTAFALIDAFDSLYKRKCIDGEERSFGDEQEPLPSPAERIYSNIKDYWSPKK